MPKQEPRQITLQECRFAIELLRGIEQRLEKAAAHMDETQEEFWVYSRPSFDRMLGAARALQSTIDESLFEIASGNPIGPESKKGRKRATQVSSSGVSAEDQRMVEDVDAELAEESKRRAPRKKAAKKGGGKRGGRKKSGG